MNRDFFSILRKRTRREPDEGFDRRFWSRFEAEFGEERARTRVFSLDFFWTYRLQFSAAAAALAVASAALLVRPGDPFEAASKAGVEPALLASWTEVEKLEPDLEMLETLEDVALSDSDWDVLLEGTS